MSERAEKNGARLGLGLCACCLALSLAACSTTAQTRKVKPSGFLGDYSQLREGAKGEALLVYVNPDANFSAYSRVIIDPITLWFGEDSNLSKVKADDLQKLADHLYIALYNQLKEDYEIVQRPGLGVLRVRAAITEAQGSKVVLDTVSNVLPPMIVAGLVKKLATGTQIFVGKAAVEAEILDSLTNARLLAAVDKRAGRKVLRGKFGTWNDVKEAYDYWADELQQRLRALRWE